MTDDELVDSLIRGLGRDTNVARERLKNALTWRSDTTYHPPPTPPPASSNPGRKIRESDPPLGYALIGLLLVMAGLIIWFIRQT